MAFDLYSCEIGLLVALLCNKQPIKLINEVKNNVKFYMSRYILSKAHTFRIFQLI